MKKILILSYVLFLLPITANAQVEDTTLIHTVKPGENLHTITRVYLGTDILWRDNWKLNPHVKNPHMLTIGEELVIIKQRIIPAKKATMRDIINNVEKKLVIGEWLQAKTGDQLRQQEGVRTLESSSTLLEFDETSSLKILEFSQVFLQSRKTSVLGTDSSTVEIIEGDTELKWKPLNIKNSEIEIISGQTKLVPGNIDGKLTALRTGIAQNGNSVVSVYEGSSDVESAGTNITVPKGMGVSVKQGEKPPQPKPLMKSPVVDVNYNALSINYSNPILKWNGIPMAKQYMIEVCQDKLCNQIISQIKTNNTQTQISKIQQSGNYFWRVAAVSDDDLVGYKTKPFSINITSDIADNFGPSIAINVVGKHKVEKQQITVEKNAKLNIFSADQQSGFDKLYYRWNQDTLVYMDNMSSLLDIKPGTLTIQAKDNLGNESAKTYNISLE